MWIAPKRRPRDLDENPDVLLAMGKTKGRPLPNNDPIQLERVVQLRRGLKRSEVREGAF